MKNTMNEFDFKNEFKKIRPDNFSYDGLKALYDYLINLEDDTGVEMEFDPVELCCNYSEYDNFEQLKNNYSDIENFKELEDETSVIKIPNTKRFIIQNY